MENSLDAGQSGLKVEATQTAAPAVEETGNTDFDIWSGFGVSTGVRKALTEDIAKFHEYCCKTVKDLPFKVEIINDADKSQAPIQLVIAEKGAETLAYAMLLEKGLFEPIRHQQKSSNNVNVSYNPTASGLITKELNSAVTKELVERGYKNIRIIHCAVLPEAADLELQKVSDYMMTYALLALNAGNRQITAAHLNKAESAKVVASYDFKPGSTRINPLGRPLATDFTITTELRTVTKNNQQQTNQPRRNIRLSNVNGYVDAIYRSDANNAGVGQAIFAAQQKASPSYIATVIANEINGLSGSSRAEENIMTQVFGIVSLANLASGKKWSRAFLKVPGSETSKTSIGVVGLECNVFNDPNFVPKELSVVSYGLGNTDDITLAGIVNNYFHPLCLVAMDITRGGVSEFTQRHFEKASKGDIDSIRLINKAVDDFTGGALSSKWDMNKSPVNSGSCLMHVAHYNDSTTAEIKDRDSIDYFAALDVFQGNAQAMNDLTVSPECNGVVSLTKRFETINGVAPLTQTAWKVRVYFKNDWLNAVVGALKTAKCNIVPENLDTPQDTSRNSDSILGLDVDGIIDTQDLFSGSLRDNPVIDDDLFSSVI